MPRKNMQMFKDLVLYATFFYGGSRWMKTSTRTARLNGNGKVFYFGMKELLEVDE